MAIDFAPFIGIGKVVHEQNQQRDQFQQQELLNTEAEKRHATNAAIEHFRGLSEDPNGLPEAKDFSARTYLDLVSKVAQGGYKAIKDSDVKNAWMQLGQISMGARKAQLQKTLGVNQQDTNRVAAAATTAGATTASGMDPESEASHGLASSILNHVVNAPQPEQPNQPDPSSSPYYTPQEHTDMAMNAERQKKEVDSQYTFHNAAPGDAVFRGNNPTPIFQVPPRQTQHDEMRKIAYHEYSLNHGIPETEVEQRGLASAALQEYADRAAKSKTMGGNMHPVVIKDPWDPTKYTISWEQAPVTTVRPGGGAAPGTVPPPASARAVHRGGPAPITATPGSGLTQPTTSTSTAPEPYNDWRGRTDQPFSNARQLTPHQMEAISRLPEGEQPIVQGLLDYTIAPPTSGMGMRSPAMILSIADAKRIDPTFDEKQYAIRFNLIKKMSSGKNADGLRSLNQAISHLGRYIQSAKDLDNPDWRPAGWVQNQFREMTSDPRLASMRDDITATSDEAANLFKATGSTDTTIKAWERNANINAGTPAQIAHARELIHLMAGRVSSIVGEWNRTMGPERNWRALDDESVAILKENGLKPEEIDPMLKDGGGGQSILPQPSSAPTSRGVTAQPRQKPTAVPKVPNRSIPPPPPGFNPVG